MFIQFSPKHLYDQHLEFFIISTSSSSFFEVNLKKGVCAFTWNIFLSLYVAQFSVFMSVCLVRSDMFPALGLIQDTSYGVQQHAPLVTRDICSRGAPYVSCKYPSVVTGLTTVGTLAGKADSQPSWQKVMIHAVTSGLIEGGVGFPSSCLCGPEGCWAGVTHKWVEPGTRVVVRAGLGGGCGLELVPAHSWVGPDPWCLQYREGRFQNGTACPSVRVVK